MILGMDLSLALPAFCVAEVKHGKISVIHLSHIVTNKDREYGYRINQIYEHVKEILQTYPIDVVVKEKGFSMHVTTTAKLRGVDAVVQLCVYQVLNIEEYPQIPPTTIKKAITNDGKAKKPEIIANIGKYLYSPVKLSAGKAKEDEADAIATVITYALQKKLI